MPILEVIASLSLILAFGVPGFFEKVMRPGYDKKVALFRKDIIEKYRSSLEEALSEFNKDKGLTDETIEKMDDVTDSWTEVRVKVNTLERLLEFRLWFFAGCMITLGTSLLGIYSQSIGKSLWGLDWVKVSSLFFGVIWIILFYHGYQIFRFDRELAAYSEEEKPEIRKIVEKEPVKYKGLKAEEEVTQILKENDIPYSEDGKVGRFIYDVVVPNIKNPKVFVEIKLFRRRFLYSGANRIILMLMRTKEKYPDSKVVLITNPENIPKHLKQEIESNVDKMFNIENLQDFIHFIKQQVE